MTGSVENGAKKTAMCVGCHGIIGYQASFPEIHKVPMIAGQSATYIVSALGAYKNGDRKTQTGFRGWDMDGDGRFELLEVLDPDGTVQARVYDFDGDGRIDLKK